jgi:hypothetical protein
MRYFIQVTSTDLGWEYYINTYIVKGVQTNSGVVYPSWGAKALSPAAFFDTYEEAYDFRIKAYVGIDHAAQGKFVLKIYMIEECVDSPKRTEDTLTERKLEPDL